MSTKPTLLVVDDEQVICHACSRIFRPQGFAVETCNDALEGLRLAAENDYSVILLDIKMPGLDGLSFLEGLRKTKPHAPVVFITGYPNVQSAASAVRLGAADYVTKPFSPEEITQAVQRVLHGPEAGETCGEEAEDAKEEPWAAAEPDQYFCNEAWFQRGQDGTYRVGAALARAESPGAVKVRMPRAGEVVYQGLPLMGLESGGTSHSVSAPISGVVVAVNELLGDYPATLWDKPCQTGWIACIAPTRPEEETKACSIRRVILANGDPSSAGPQADHLARLGCRVIVARDRNELIENIEGHENNVVLIDVASFGDSDPAVVQRVNAAAPATRIVIIGTSESKWEAAYREGGVFYYAVEPFADNEIADILDSAFRHSTDYPPTGRGRALNAEPLSAIWITNRHRRRVCLLVDAGLLREGQGLGWVLEHRLRSELYPMERTVGSAELSSQVLLRAATECDRLLVLASQDLGRLPGSLVLDTKGQHVPVPEEHADKITALVVQPGGQDGGAMEFEPATTGALAAHIVREMGVC